MSSSAGREVPGAARERGLFVPLLAAVTPDLGGEETYPFTVNVRSTANQSIDLSGQVIERAYIPYWHCLLECSDSWCCACFS